MRRLLITIAALSVTALPVAGCGGNEQEASSAAELVPGGAVMYGEATLKPEGDQKAALDSLLAKFPGGGEAGQKLKEAIEKGLQESKGDVTFKDDIEPWLGDQAAFFARGLDLSGGFEASALLVATDDEGKAEDALEKSAEGKVTKQDYNGVEYLTDESEGEANAAAVFDGYVVLGNEAGVKAAIDTSKGDPKLSDEDGFTKALDGASDDRLGFFYLNPSPLLTTIERQGAPLPGDIKDLLRDPVVATLDADDDGAVVEASVPESLGKAAGLFGQGSNLLTDLPADSWLALAQNDLGKTLDFYVESLAGAAGGRDVVERQLRAATGLDLQRDVIDWMGDFGVFVRGTSVADLDGALVVETSDEAASERFLDALARLANGQADNPGDRLAPKTPPGGGKGYVLESSEVPKPVYAFVRDGKVVFAYGDAAARDAGDSGNTLGSSPEFAELRDSLGNYDVSFYMLMQPIIQLADSAGASSDEGWQEAKPYLEPISGLVGGSSGSGPDLKSAFKVVVK